MAKSVLAVSVALCMMMWLPAAFSFVLSFNIAAQLLAIFTVAVIGLWFAYKNNFAVKGFGNELLASGKAFFMPLPFFLISVFLLFTHVIPTGEDGGLQSGQSTFGDMPMHLSFITSISEQKFFPPLYNLVGDSLPMGYPFLCDSISSTFYTLSGNLRFAYILPMIPALFAVIYGVWIFFESWLNEQSKVFMASLLFFVGGGFGFVYFVDLLKSNPDKLMSIFTGYYTTPMNFSEKNVLWVNSIADMLIPQRATLFGWSILIPVLFLLYKAAFCGKKNYFCQIGILAGALPLIHTHSFLALGVLSAVYLAFEIYDVYTRRENLLKSESLKPWLVYGLMALLLALPQLLLFTFKQAEGENFMRMHFNWVNERDNYFWFYIKNIGLPYLLIIPALLHAKKEMRRLYYGGLVLLLLAEFFVFQPNKYDNNKLIFLWYLLNCGLFSNFAIDLYKNIKTFAGAKYIACMVLILCNLSGVLTLGREAVSDLEVFTASDVAAAEFIKANLEKDALFLTANNHNNAVASLTGRNILCGSGSYLYFHGVDYGHWQEQQELLFNRPSMAGLQKNRIDYVYIGPYERYNYPDMNTAFFSESLNLIYSNTGVRIYEVPGVE